MTRFAFLLLAFGLAVSPARAQYFAFGKNKVQYDAPNWRYVQSEHFDVFYYEREATAPGGRVLATFAAEAAEEAYREVAPLFGYQLARRVPLLVYPTHPEFAVTNAVDLPVYAEGIGGVTELFKNRIAVPFTGDWRDFRRVIHHELVHAVVNDVYFGGSLQSLVRRGLQLNIPPWFGEGLAEYSALGWDTQSDMYVRDAVLNGRLAPIPRLRGYYAYRGGQGVWDFVAEEYGREKVTEILERVRLGRSVSGAFRQATGLGLDELSDRWHRALRTVYYPEAAAREETEAVARPIATRRTTGAGYHASPAISPQGDKVAYVASEDGLFDVYVVPTVGRRPARKLIDGQDNTQFESLRLLSPGLSWSPDGSELAVAVKSGPGDAIAIVDEATGRVRTLRPQLGGGADGIDAIVSVAWSPDGSRIAFEGTAGAHSDLYVVELATERVTNLTRDLFSDHAPAWAPDGRSLVFHSDRGDALQPGGATARAADAQRFDARSLGRGDFDLYRISADGSGVIERLTDDPVWDETDAALALGPDGRERLLYVSDRNGVPNLYARDSLGRDRPRTDLQTGVMRLSLSADGSRAAILALDQGTPSVYLARDPFGRDDLPRELAPTVWAQRRLGLVEDAPSVQIASAVTRSRNAFLRDASDGEPLAPPPRLPRPPTAADLARVDSILNRLASSTPSPLLASRDTLAAAFALDPFAPERGFRADFRDYDFSDAFDEAVSERTSGVTDPFEISGHRDSTGALVTKRYKLAFTPDLVSAAGGYDTVYGVQSVTRMRFSDLLGNHQISVATNLVLDLRNADYVIGYEALEHRTDLRFQGFHLARELPNLAGTTIYRYRNYGLLAGASYPLDKFRRVEGELGVLGVSLTDLSDLGRKPRSRVFAVPRVTLTSDRTVPGGFTPQSGARWAASLSGSPGPNATFATALVDGRMYRTFGPGYAFAARASAGLSLGPEPQRFYAAGVENWIGASFDSLPVRNEDDFVFATPVLPLRGFGYDEAAGDRFALVNVEARVPLVAALLPGPVPFLPLYDLQLVGFADAGVIAQGGVDLFDDGPIDETTGEPGPRVLDDVLLGTGVGLRTVVLGYPVRLDWAWPFDGREFGETRLYLSLGVDF